MYQQPPLPSGEYHQTQPSQFQHPAYPPTHQSYPPQSGYLPPHQQMPPQQQTSFTPPPPSFAPMQQPSKKPKTWIWIVACLLCLVIGYAAGSGGKSAPSTTTTTSTDTQQSQSQNAKPTTAPKPQGHHLVGQTVTTDKWQLKVNTAATSQGTDFIKPKAGMVFVELNITMKNLTNETQDASSLVMWDLKSASDGQKQNISLSDKPSLDGKVEVGGVLTGTLTYEVPTSVKKYTLSFTGGMFDNSLELWDISI